MSLVLRGIGVRVARDTWALRDVDLDVAPGEVVAVVGPSGSGKTTLLRAVSGLRAPDEGAVVLDGAPLAGTPPERRPVAVVPQGYALFPHLTALENIAFGLRVRRVPRRDRDARAREAAGRLRLDGLLDRLPSELSGGERQRVALARALVRDPRVFCLDEPLSALDPLLRTDARAELAPLLRADGRSALVVTHDRSEALSLGDRVAVLRAGRLEQVGTPRELHAAPATPFVARFLSDPPVSLLDGVDGASGGVRAAAAPPGPCTLGLRAEDVELQADGDDLVVDVEDHGHEARVRVRTAGGDVVARARPGQAPPPGTRVRVVVPPERVLVWPGHAGQSPTEPSTGHSTGHSTGPATGHATGHSTGQR